MSTADDRPGRERGEAPITDRAGLSHLDEQGRAHMVDVGDKGVSRRTARATCQVRVSSHTAELLATGRLPKGDAVTVARVAGIQAAKRTAELIPFCHQVDLAHVEVAIDADPARGTVTVTGEARATDRTGVEMEALVATSLAALTVYDMVKAVERGATITELRLLAKTGGQRGDWQAHPSP